MSCGICLTNKCVCNFFIIWQSCLVAWLKSLAFGFEHAVCCALLTTVKPPSTPADNHESGDLDNATIAA
jgi:hypothetical protein